MNTPKILSIATLCALIALAGGCSTPDTRISHSPEAFARLNPDQQALVKAGRIAVGFDMESVRLALGDPDHVVVHTDATGEHEVWHYVTYEDYEGAVIYTGYYHRYWGWGGPFFYGGSPYFNGYPARVRDRIRVEFGKDSRVVSIQQVKA